MATLDRPYTTLERLKRELQVAESENNNDQWFQLCINDASRMTEEMTNRDFLFHDHATTPLEAKTHWVFGDIIYLPFPIVTLTEIKINDVAISADTFKFELADIKKGSSKIFRTAGLFWSSHGFPTEGDGISDKFQDTPVHARERLIGIDPGPLHHDITNVTIELTGTFGYILALTDPLENPPTDLPFGIIRMTTLIAAAMSGENRKQFNPLDSGGAAPIEFTEYRIPPQAIKIAQSYKQLIL